MQDEPSPDKTPPPNPDQDPTKRVPEGEAGVTAESATPVRGSAAEVIGASTVASASTVIGASNDLDFVDEALDALDQDDLERAEELAERLQSSDTSDQS